MSDISYSLKSIYTQHDAAFSRVSAFVVAKDGERVATIAFKFPADGAGRLYAYVHWIGVEMVRGHAGGYGYDKRSAACSVAARKLRDIRAKETPDGGDRPITGDAFVAALERDNGANWDDRLRRAGFEVWQAV